MHIARRYFYIVFLVQLNFNYDQFPEIKCGMRLALKKFWILEIRDPN